MSFRDEINEVIKSPEDAKREQRNKDVQNANYWAAEDYKRIKEKVKELAREGKYKYENGRRVIRFDDTNGHIRIWINKETIKGFDKYGVPVCKGMRFRAVNDTLVEAYKKELKRLSSADDISVEAKAVFLGTDLYYDVPGVLQPWSNKTHPSLILIEIVLKCSFVV